MNNNRLSQVLYLISLGISTLLISFILLASLNLNEAEFFSTFLYGYKVPFFIIFCSTFLFVILYLIHKLIVKTKLDKKQLFPYLILATISFLQIFFILKMKASLRYDTLKIFDEAISLANGNVLSPEYSSGYFAKYPNNIPMCVITCLLLKIPKFFKFSTNTYMIFVQIINVFMIDISFFFSYLFLCKIRNKNLGILFLLLCLFNPLTYLLSAFYYTHTFSMAFSTGAIYFFVCCIQTKTIKKRCLYAFLTGFFICIGFKIRATVIIIPIAIFIYLLLNIKLLTKKSLYALVAFIGALIIGFTGYYSIESNYVKFDYNKTGYPATHWIMLGLQETGGYNATDDAYTQCFKTKLSKTKATKSVIKQRVKKLGSHGLVKLWERKMKITWSDGTDDFIDNISMTKSYGIKNDLISGSSNDILVTYCHIYHFMLLFFLFISVCSAFFRRPDNLLYIVILNLLGGILFHIIWEAGEVYNISFSCCILLLATEGFYICSNHIDSIKKQNVKWFFLTSSTLLGLLCSGYVGSKLFNLPYTHYEYAMKQDLAEPDVSMPLLEGNVLCQTFTTQRPFNKIGIKVRNPLGNENCSSYIFQLLNSDDEILFKTNITGAWAFDKDYYQVDFDTIVPNSNEEFKIKIIPDIVSKVHFLTFQSYRTGNYDIYQNGILYENDIATDYDLTFIVFNKVDHSFINK